MSLATQRNFAAALFSAGEPLPHGLTSWNSTRPARRLAVYQNNVVSSLIAALQSRFPVTEKIVGETFFKRMAKDYIILHPPCSPILLEFGNDFAEFVDAFVPAAGLGYLPDVTRLEIARGRAYHAPDLVPLDTQRLSDLDPSSLPNLTFTFHPSMTIVTSNYPIVKIWAMNAGDLPLEPIDVWETESALVTRHELEVLVHVLPKGGADFVKILTTGAPLGDAFEYAIGATEDFDLTSTLACLFRMGAVTAIE